MKLFKLLVTYANSLIISQTRHILLILLTIFLNLLVLFIFKVPTDIRFTDLHTIQHFAFILIIHSILTLGSATPMQAMFPGQTLLFQKPHHGMTSTCCTSWGQYICSCHCGWLWNITWSMSLTSDYPTSFTQLCELHVQPNEILLL